MVLPSHAVPPDAGWVGAELQRLRAELQEIKSILARQSLLADEVAFLSGQHAFDYAQIADSVHPTTATPTTWLPFTPNSDASVEIDIDDGMSVIVSAWLRDVSCSTSDCTVSLVVEVLMGDDIVLPYSLTPFSAPGGIYASEYYKSIPMPERQFNIGGYGGAGRYTFRIRRAYTSAGAASLYFTGSTLSVAKVHL